MEMLFGYARESTRLQAVMALGHHGAAARDALPMLEEIVRCETGWIRFEAMVAIMMIEGTRKWHLAALLGTKDARAVPFLAKVLRQGDTNEVRSILEKAHEVEGSAALSPVFLEWFEGPPIHDLQPVLIAAVRCDPGFTREETTRLLVLALDNERPPSRRFALESLRYAKALTPAVAVSLAAPLPGAVEERWIRAAGFAIDAAARIGRDAAPIVPALLRMIEVQGLQFRVVEALAKIDPAAPGCLEAFRHYATAGSSSSVVIWCLRGTRAIGKPTPTDVAILEEVLAEQGAHRHSAGREAIEILSLPEWKELRGK